MIERLKKLLVRDLLDCPLGQRKTAIASSIYDVVNSSAMPKV